MVSVFTSKIQQPLLLRANIVRSIDQILKASRDFVYTRHLKQNEK